MDHRASATAVLIAAATVMRGDTSGPGTAPAGAPAWCERFLSTTLSHHWLLASSQSAPGRACWRLLESLLLPGAVSHWMRRKREIDRLARDAAANGFTQLVVIGAGLDSLAFRVCEERLYPSIVFADHPATLNVIRKALGADARDMARGIEFISLDLAQQEINTVLAAAPGFDRRRSTLVVIEGVLMYLSEPDVARVLRSIVPLPNPSVRMIISWMVAEPGKPVGFAHQSRFIPAWLARRSEPMLWGSTPAAIPAFLDGLGWSNTRVIDLAGDDRLEPAEARGLQSEQLAVAERDRLS
ncbi:class I SAM-dependent methyltransferase [Roseiarcaceae bacterium H3SJ34-1]|uniref:class I SAM-dependent methyltransferase n=1 Tax=Terripilifer ovatus TaxID=3032367 RepID=UPI003AB9B043|nr:class I SAM-dependent methyltransferase [Roseiarcaceae bacterium H3SJ34-1]